jgi:hypothetical protein
VSPLNAQTPTGIMISTKKQFHLLGENQRQSSPSLTNQTLCVYEHFKLQTINGIESFWGYAKIRLVKFKGMNKKMFDLHLKECEFRFNNRKQNLYKVFGEI